MSINANYSGDPVADATGHLNRLDRLPVDMEECTLCQQDAPEDCLTVIKSTGDKICMACKAGMTIEKIREHCGNDAEAVLEFTKELYPELNTTKP